MKHKYINSPFDSQHMIEADHKKMVEAWIAVAALDDALQLEFYHALKCSLLKKQPYKGW
jgi:hypothetical protein